MRVEVQPRGFGAVVHGVNLSGPLSAEQVAELRRLWLDHQVLAFPDQPMTHEDLERFTLAFGDFGHDPYVRAIEGHEHVLEIRREPDEQVPPFGAAWHSDWSFQETPPAATLLHAKIVPPVGGDTLFADGYAALEALDPGLVAELECLTALHSARRPYSLQGFYASGGDRRSMTILPSDDALETMAHPVIRTHPETGRRALWVNAVYTIGILDMTAGESEALLVRLFAHSVEPRFQYRQRWQRDMLTMWDNRCVQHCAQGGYDGHRRVLHRTTLAGDRPR